MNLDVLGAFPYTIGLDDCGTYGEGGSVTSHHDSVD